MLSFVRNALRIVWQSSGFSMNERNGPDRFGKGFTLAVIGLLIAVEIIIFMPNLGHGFITDDFHWLSSLVEDGKVNYIKPFKETTGFFRPLVAISFGIQYRLFGLDAGAFGMFNLLIHVLNTIIIYLLLAGYAKTRPYALLATLLFALNAKADQHAVGWISGRTSLLFTFFLLLSLIFYWKRGRNRYLCLFLTGLFYLASLLSKETAVVVPIFFFCLGFSKYSRTGHTPVSWGRVKAGLAASWIFYLPLALYFILRAGSDAMTPLNAPAHYTFNLSPRWLVENIFEYMIRAGLLDIYIILLMVVCLILAGKKRMIAGAEYLDKPVFFLGFGWFLVFLLPVLAVPNRSNMYAYSPQIGLHVATAAAVFYLWRRFHPEIKTKRIILCLTICILSVSWLAYLYGRARGISRRGECSALFTRQVVMAVAQIRPWSHVIVIDRDCRDEWSPTSVVSFGFASLLNLYSPGKHLGGEIISSRHRAEGMSASPDTWYFVWHNGHLKRLPGRGPRAVITTSRRRGKEGKIK